ncbi:shikimate kinase [Paracoccus rhizosphaerae]|uniref:Shikimate kinase n=1 Tax=Paracoccus rhizosphaerae TaxID=1133347 RepID=A0ABV6CN38_9RHOB|nr:shikimate kinase [Paracoccus rhizosphaerae]
MPARAEYIWQFPKDHVIQSRNSKGAQMTGRLTRHIVLIGMMGAGKTAIGTELARRLRVPFTDSDIEIEAAAAMTITEIFARDGEAFFRAREAQVLARLLAGPAGVISTGGGAWMQPGNRDLIGASGMSVWLNCDPELLWQRVRQRQTRPLLQTADPKGTLLRLLAERSPVYATAEVEFVSRAGDSIESSALRLIAQLRATDPGLMKEA